MPRALEGVISVGRLIFQPKGGQSSGWNWVPFVLSGSKLGLRVPVSVGQIC